MKYALLTLGNANVISVDWSLLAAAATLDYNKAAALVSTVGQTTAAFLRQGNVNLQKVYCIGHSLGNKFLLHVFSLKRL
jgi:hypothetical protein